MTGYWVDIAAVGFFVIEWCVYAITLEHTAYARDSLSARMHVYREIWVRNLLAREARMVDMQIMTSLQNGTAFFASTSLIAIGGALALLRATSDALAVLGALPINLSPSPALWEVKCVGLILIFIYTFFKFAWAYRLFNYAAILIGATPQPGADTDAAALDQARRAGAMQTVAARDFNRGLRAFFFALAFIGWLLSPIALIVSTTAVVIVLYRRQFGSAAVLALAARESSAAEEN